MGHYVLFIVLAESKRMFNKVSVWRNTVIHQCCVMLFIHSIISCLPQHRELNWGSQCLVSADCSVRFKVEQLPPMISVIPPNWSVYQVMLSKAMRLKGDSGVGSSRRVGAFLRFHNRLRNR